MNPNIAKLYAVAQKEERWIIGLMSGTSMDGLDIALCSFKGSGGETEVKIIAFETIDFSEAIKDEIRAVFAKKTINFQHLCLLNPWVGNLHGSLINAFLVKQGIDKSAIDAVASHGQTVFHAPKILHGIDKFPNATLQIGDGDHVAVTTGILTLSDFRQKHCAAGGEGAPLAVYGDYLIFSQKNENRILLNMGGIANFTFLPGDLDANRVFATDTGTGNTLIDAFARKYFNVPYDANAEISSSGQISESLLQALKQDDFFKKPFPKTTGPELFSMAYVENAQAQSNTQGLTKQDVMATLTRFSAETIAEAIKTCFQGDEQYSIYGSGGGVHNPLLMRHLQGLLPNSTIRKTDELGISGDAKEAVLFATLANEALCGGRTDFGSRRGVPSVSMGKISFPA